MSELNDPRVLFAAERTSLAWNRTSISLMAFGFVIERFDLFLQVLNKKEVIHLQRHVSFFVGIAFILLASFLALYSIIQHRRILKTLKAIEIPQGYNLWTAMLTNGIVGVLGLILSLYLFKGFI
jgi:putative membrane protein